jgi:hypothetical protein
LAIAEQLGHHRPAWQGALKNLGNAIRTKPYLFNMTKSRYSMDWFYPILCGAVTGADAHERLDKYWKKFVVNGLGVRCVSDHPWITVAETSELSLALSAMGNQELAEIVFSWIHDKRYEDGSYWCGFTFPDRVIWPDDKLTWTNAVVLMAADALYHMTPAGRLFSHRFWMSSEVPSVLDNVPTWDRMGTSKHFTHPHEMHPSVAPSTVGESSTPWTEIIVRTLLKKPI